MERKLEIEVGQGRTEYEAFTDDGNHQIFTPSAVLLSAYEDPEVHPDGIYTGANLISAGTANNTVAVAAHTGYSQGTLHSVAAGSVEVTRPATDVAKVISITVTSAGELAAVAGTDGSDTTFVETRGEAGGPPYIPVGSYEIGQVRLTATADAVITSDQIKQNGDYTEFSEFPVFTVNNLGNGIKAEGASDKNAYVEFNEVLDTRHTGGTCKGVYGTYLTPSFAELPKVKDFSPASTSHSISSTETFNETVGDKTTSLGQASFSILLKDGVSDQVVAQQDKNVLFRHYPNRNASGYILTQGYLAVDDSYTGQQRAEASCTITPERASVRFQS
jgi:hypothetical protein